MKKQIRKEILLIRQALDGETVQENSRKICRKLSDLGAFKHAHTVMAYIPFRNEVDVTHLFNLLWGEGKEVVIPVCDVKNIALIPSRLDSLEKDLRPGAWGILEPKPDCVRPVSVDRIDLVIVPGVAFDPKCNRLGYGGGYYDRFFSRLKEGTPKVAVSFEVQIVAKLVPEVWDVPMDMVITEAAIYCR